MPAAEVGPHARISNSMICDGSRVDGDVSGSLIGPGVVVPAGCSVIDSIILPNVTLGAGSRIERTIIDKNVVVGNGAHVGHGRGGAVNTQIPTLLNSGLTLIGMHTTIPNDARIGTNVLIPARVAATSWQKIILADGETLGGA